MNRIVLLTALASAGLAPAGVIVQNITGTDPTSEQLYWGQQFTTPAGGPWDDLTFNFFSNLPPTTEVAAGTAFLLNVPYTGTPAELSPSAPGFLADTSTITGGQYVFANGVELQPGTTYYIYENTPLSLTGGNFVTNEESFLSPLSSDDFEEVFIGEDTPGTANFSVNGNITAPEPASIGLLVSGFAALEALRSRRRGGSS